MLAAAKTPSQAAAGVLVHQREAELWRNSSTPANVRTPQLLCRNGRMSRELTANATKARKQEQLSLGFFLSMAARTG